MSLADSLARIASRRAALAIECPRCQKLRAPGPDLGRAVCRGCLVELATLFRDETGVGLLEGRA